MAARVDLVALHPDEYAASRAPRVIPTAPARYLSLDGAGDVGGVAFLEQAGRLTALLRELRARVRRDSGKDFRLPPLEALLGAPRAPGVGIDARGPIPWKLLLRIPAFVRPGDLAALRGEAAGDPDGAGEARIEELREGRCIQALHAGAPAEVHETVDRLRRAAADLDLLVRGRVHEVWLSDPARSSPDRHRTLVRLPVKPR
jgi:hypothetical protein